MSLLHCCTVSLLQNYYPLHPQLKERALKGKRFVEYPNKNSEKYAVFKYLSSWICTVKHLQSFETADLV